MVPFRPCVIDEGSSYRLGCRALSPKLDPCSRYPGRAAHSPCRPRLSLRYRAGKLGFWAPRLRTVSPRFSLQEPGSLSRPNAGASGDLIDHASHLNTCGGYMTRSKSDFQWVGLWHRQAVSVVVDWRLVWHTLSSRKALDRYHIEC